MADESTDESTADDGIDESSSAAVDPGDGEAGDAGPRDEESGAGASSEDDAHEDPQPDESAGSKPRRHGVKTAGVVVGAALAAAAAIVGAAWAVVAIVDDDDDYYGPSGDYAALYDAENGWELAERAERYHEQRDRRERGREDRGDRRQFVERGRRDRWEKRGEKGAHGKAERDTDADGEKLYPAEECKPILKFGTGEGALTVMVCKGPGAALGDTEPPEHPDAKDPSEDLFKFPDFREFEGFGEFPPRFFPFLVPEGRQPFEGDARPFRDGERPFGGREWPFEGDARPFRDGERPFGGREWPFGEDAWPFRDGEWPFGGREWPFGEDAWPFRDGEWPFGGGEWPFGEDAWPFKAEPPFGGDGDGTFWFGDEEGEDRFCFSEDGEDGEVVCVGEGGEWSEEELEELEEMKDLFDWFGLDEFFDGLGLEPRESDEDVFHEESSDGSET